MPADKLSTYVSKTTTYLQSTQGKHNFNESRGRFGYSYQQALCVAVMVATGLRIYERISAVVDALMAREMAA